MDSKSDARLRAVVEPVETADATLEAHKEDFLWRLKVTSGSRFNAAKRLSRRDALVTILNAVANITVIFLSVVLATVKAGENATVMLTLFTILASIALLATTIFQYAFKDGVYAERMESCGFDISALRRKALYSNIQNRQDLMIFVNTHSEIMARYPNHAEVDYQRYRDENPDEFKGHADRGTGPGGTLLNQLITGLLAAASVTLALGALSAILAAIDKWPIFSGLFKLQH
ncbi:MAG TPA: SLATT domain-containing protein [Stellaceae bacterium]|nr:SLATT domain-containing protein [Stellaceae bacterium]